VTIDSPGFPPRPQPNGEEVSSGSGQTITVLYIGGGTKSGSTLLDLMAGQLPGFFSVGELRQLWQRGLVEDSRCGCHERFSACPFWGEVGRKAFGGWSNVDLEEKLEQRNSLDRLSSLRALKEPGAGSDPRMGSYVGALQRVLEAIRLVSGAAVIVDSSKTPTHALLLRRVPGVDVRLVHLVRDSRGTVFSWKRANRGQRRRRKLRSLRRRLGINTAASIRWFSYNARIPSLERLGVPYLFVRYEDLVAEPHSALSAIAQHAGRSLGSDDLSFVSDGHVVLGSNHTVYGNRLRFSQGELPLRVDDAWRREMSAASRLWVTAMTFPLLRRYGYPLLGTRSGRTEVKAPAT
jgi:hypothetical protein